MTTCDNRRVPRQATGNTPVRNARIGDEDWLPMLAKSELEGSTASDVLAEATRRYWQEPEPVAYELTFANWPAAATWLEPKARHAAFAAMDADLSSALNWNRTEYVNVAAWLATDRHPADVKQQSRIIAGHILRDLPRDDSALWRAKYRDRRHLTVTILDILSRHLPLG